MGAPTCLGQTVVSSVERSQLVTVGVALVEFCCTLLVPRSVLVRSTYQSQDSSLLLSLLCAFS